MDSEPRPVVLVTGAAGLIGTRVVQEFARDHRVVGLDVKEPDGIPQNASWLHCDLTDDDATRAALARIRAVGGSTVEALSGYPDRGRGSTECWLPGA